MPVPLPPASLLAAAPAPAPVVLQVPRGAFVPFEQPTGATAKFDSATDTELAPVQIFDPAARAQGIAAKMPRRWSGTYQAFGGSAPVPVVLNFEAVTAVGAMVVLRGAMTIAGQTTPVQGNLNAQSDQLDLLPLARKLGAGLNPGGSFQGLQGIALSGWNADRLTDLGGRLALAPQAMPIRGLW